MPVIRPVRSPYQYPMQQMNSMENRVTDAAHGRLKDLQE